MITHKFLLLAVAGTLLGAACAPVPDATEPRLVQKSSLKGAKWPSLADVPNRPDDLLTYEEQQKLFERLDADRREAEKESTDLRGSTVGSSEIEDPVVPNKAPSKPSKLP